MDALERLRGDTWFRLGDNDLATHLWRTAQIEEGASLLQITDTLARQLGIHSHIHPMCEERVSTIVHSEGRNLPFQHYFVREQCKPPVTGFSFEGIAQASPNPNVMALLADEAFSAIVVCPSNPFVSVDPILQIPQMWTTLRDSAARLVLVSPIVGGIALKGPAAKMMSELGVPVTALGVAQHYCDLYPDLLDCFVIDESDATLAPDIASLGVEVVIAPTIMNNLGDKQRLAQCVLGLVG
jgi:LPPG:FO 2-phospho-L-lactate transferase